MIKNYFNLYTYNITKDPSMGLFLLPKPTHTQLVRPLTKNLKGGK